MTLTRTELVAKGFAAIGEDVRVHPSALFFGVENIRLGSRVRIDCHAVVSAGPDGVDIGSHVHLAAGVYLFGSGGRIILEDFAGLSARVAVYTATDDYTDGHLTNPTVPDTYRKVIRGPVTFRRHAIVGTGSVVMPGVELGVGASVGALSFVTKSVPEFAIVFGSPARKVGERDRKLLALEQQFRAAEGEG